MVLFVIDVCVWLWWRLGEIDIVIILRVVIVGWQLSSGDESIDGVCKVNSVYWFKDDPMGDVGDDSSWPFRQVKEAGDKEDEDDDDVEEEIGDDKETVFVFKTGDKNL